MMNIQQKRDLLMSLPLMEQEQRWIMERLDTLSVKEQYQLSAAILRTGKLEELAGKTGWELETAILHMDPEVAVDAVNCLLSLEDYQICFPAGSYAQLGSFYLRHESHLPERAMYYADLEALGRRYEDRHPGLFVGNCYVEYPEHPSAPRCTGQGLIPEDDGWSMKVKLASSAVPEGVWLRLPDYSAMTDRPDEVALALDELKTRSLENCMLLDVRCSLPELGNLMEQYDSALELVNDGSDLGYVLDEQGQGMPHFMERFAAALEFEHCRDLRLALDISQNLHCYEWVPRDGLKDFGRRKLLEAGVSEELLDSGCIDLEGYGADLLEEAGYVLTADESAYITRNNLEFLRDWSAPEEAGLSMEQHPASSAEDLNIPLIVEGKPPDHLLPERLLAAHPAHKAVQEPSPPSSGRRVWAVSNTSSDRVSPRIAAAIPPIRWVRWAMVARTSCSVAA